MADNLDTNEGFYQWANRPSEGVILVAGRSGAGKSTLINELLGLLGEDAAPAQNTGRPTTTEVKVYAPQVNNARLRIIDTPGFESHEGSKGDRKTLVELEKKSGRKADLLLYCASLQPSGRISNSDYRIMKLLTDAFKKDIWKRAILVLTFANEYNPGFDVGPDRHGSELLRETAESYALLFREGLRKINVDIPVCSNLGIIPQNYDGILAIPAGKGPEIPLLRGGNWKRDLIMLALKKTEGNDSLPIILIARGKVHTGKVLGALGGAGVVGIGLAAAGATIGGALSASLTLGIATPIGAGIGAAIGAGVGVIGFTGTGLGVGGYTVKKKLVPYSKRSEKEKELKSQQRN